MLNKVNLIKEIKKELKNIGYFDIYSVVNLLLDELKQEILTTKKVRISNFGEFNLKTFKPRTMVNVRTGKLALTKTYNILRFSISKNITRFVKNKVM